MDPTDIASNLASQTSNASNPPLAWAGVSSFNHAIALQQSQFQQSLVNKQLLAQQHAVAHAASIKAAAERAAARAAEISKLLNGEKDDVSEEKSVEFAPKKEEEPGLKPHSRSPSPPRFSKSKSRSPIRYRNSHREHEEYSQRDNSSWPRRSPSSYSRYRDHRNYSRTSYRRDTDRSGGRSYVSYHRNTGRSRRTSPLSRSTRYPSDDSRSRRLYRNRSPSPRSGHRISSRASNRRSMSKSPINRNRSSSPPRFISDVDHGTIRLDPSPSRGTCNHEGGISEHPNVPGEYTIYPLPEANEAGEEANVNSTVMVLDRASKLDAREMSMSPKPCKHPEKRFRSRSKSRERITKHHKRRHNRHHRESEADEDDRRESREEKKLRRLERKGSKHNSHDARKMKRKHRDTSPSSFSDDVDYRKKEPK